MFLRNKMAGNVSHTLCCSIRKSHKNRLYLPEVNLHGAFLIPKLWEMTQPAEALVHLSCHNPTQLAQRIALCRGMQEESSHAIALDVDGAWPEL